VAHGWLVLQQVPAEARQHTPLSHFIPPWQVPWPVPVQASPVPPGTVQVLPLQTYPPAQPTEVPASGRQVIGQSRAVPLHT
jgi:hypothetical protein